MLIIRNVKQAYAFKRVYMPNGMRENQDTKRNAFECVEMRNVGNG